MRYCVITYVPPPETNPKPGEVLAIPVVEAGCTKCVMDHAGKLKACWLHTHERILWGRTVDMPDEEGGDAK